MHIFGLLNVLPISKRLRFTRLYNPLGGMENHDQGGEDMAHAICTNAEGGR